MSSYGDYPAGNLHRRARGKHQFGARQKEKPIDEFPYNLNGDMRCCGMSCRGSGKTIANREGAAAITSEYGRLISASRAAKACRHEN